MNGVIVEIIPFIVKEQHGDFIKKCVRKCAKCTKYALKKYIIRHFLQQIRWQKEEENHPLREKDIFTKNKKKRWLIILTQIVIKKKITSLIQFFYQHSQK